MHAYMSQQMTSNSTEWRREALSGVERYSYGEDSACVSSANHHVPPTVEPVHGSLRFAPWERKVVVAEAPKTDAGVLNTPRDYGLVMHEILSCLTDADNIAAVVDNYCERHALPDEWHDRLVDQIDGLLRHPGSACFFDHRIEVRNECELMHDGKVLRPDRVLLPSGHGEAWVVDFKTGERTDAMESAYVGQVREYMQAMRSMGYPVVRGFLLYTLSATVVEM